MAKFHRPRRVPAVLTTCGLLAAAITGCSSSGSSSQTLVIAEWTNPAAVAYTKTVDALFEKQHPGVNIQLQTAPTAQSAWPTLQNSLLAAKSVDVLAQFAADPSDYPPASTGIKVSGTADLIASGDFTDLSKQSFMKRFNTASQQYVMGYKNGIYGVMVAEYVNDTGLFYKKSLLSQYGMSVPTTFNQFIDDLKTFQSHGITPIYVAGKDGYQSIVWFGIVNQLLMQGQPSSAAESVYEQRAQAFWNGTQNWNSPLYEEAVQRYEQVMSYIEPSAGGVSAQTAPGQWAVQSNNFPFFVDGSYDGNTIAQAESSLKFGFMALPGTDTASANRAALAPDLSWTVPTFAKQKTLAMDWIDLFTQPSTYAGWLKATGSDSTEPSVPTPSLSWTDWLSAHAAQGFYYTTEPWVPSSAPTDASGPVLTSMQPFGSQSPTAALNQSATDYTAALKH